MTRGESSYGRRQADDELPRMVGVPEDEPSQLGQFGSHGRRGHDRPLKNLTRRGPLVFAPSTVEAGRVLMGPAAAVPAHHKDAPRPIVQPPVAG